MRFTFHLLIFISFFTSAQVETDSIKEHQLEEIVITASKKEENLLQSPVSIEKLDLTGIKQSAQFSFFDAIENIKGVQMITPSLGFKVINARGFTNTTNVRFVQMVDGMDNQAPHIGAPIGNFLGPTDLDIFRVEIVPGSASALYGMNAINGTANFITKDPFSYQGLSIQQKTGINNISNQNIKSTPFSESSLRFAKAWKNKTAIKINVAYMKGTDWVADNRTDLTPLSNQSTFLFGQDNPGKDVVNQYGDESVNRKTLTLGGKQYVISRTGYAEKEITDYNLQNMKGNGSLYYRPKKGFEVSYIYRFAYLNTTYQRTNRFRLDDYLTQQHGITIKTNSIQAKSYLTFENTGQSYNIRSIAENIDRGYKTDDKWYKDFASGFNNNLQEGKSVQESLTASRMYADLGRPQPGTEQFSQQVNNLKTINNWDRGAALKVKARLYHAELQHDLSKALLEKVKLGSWQIMYGGDFRNYTIIPDGNYFINPTSTDKNLQYWKWGAFGQITKLFFKEKVKLNAVIRMDKNQYFTPKLNPRVSIVYSPVSNHNVRIALQQGYRFPSIFEAFSNINSGGVKRVGGLPIMSNGIFENSTLFSSIQAFQTSNTNDKNVNGLSTSQAIDRNKSLLKSNSYTYLQPERVISIETGYRTKLLKERLTFDVDFYYNMYKNLMAQVEVAVPKTTNIDSMPVYFNDKTKYDRYRLWTNSKTISYNYGGTAGLSFILPKGFLLSTNASLSKLDRKDQQDGLEDGFNTPEWIYNISVSHSKVFKSLGFLINYKKQSKYIWISSLASGEVPSFNTIDAQVNYSFSKDKVIIKLGGSNIMNQYYHSFIGGPSVGGFYYLNLNYNIL